MLLLAFIFSFLTHHSIYFILGLAFIFLLLFRDKRSRYFYYGAVLSGFLIYYVPPLFYKLPELSSYGIVLRSKSNYFLVFKSLRLYYVNYYDNPYSFGDLVKIEGEIKDLFFVRLESEFDFKTYLQSNGVHRELHKAQVSLIRRSVIFRFFNLNKLITEYDPPVQALLQTLITSERLKEAQGDTVLSALTFISLSGFHLNFIRRSIAKFVALFTKDTVAAIVSYFFLVLLFCFNPTKFAFYRIFLSAMLFFANRRFLKQTLSNLTVNLIGATIFILFNPYIIFNPAFYLAYTLIILFSLQTRKLKKERLFNFLLVYFVFTIYQVLTTNKFELLGTVTQLIFAPFYFLIVLTFFLSVIIRPLHNVVGVFSNLLLNLNAKLSLFRFPFIVGASSPFFIILMLLVFSGFYYFNELRLHKNKQFMGVLLFSVLLLKTVPLTNYLTSKLFFINVGQGDSTLVIHRGKTLLIDTGGLANKDIGQDVLIPFFHRQKVRKLDYVIITHNHFDHNGALPTLINHDYVKNVISDKTKFPFKLGDLTISNLNPGGYDDENKNSLIVYFRLLNFDILVTGDAYKENEEQILKSYPHLNIDILKVGHHGSSTSTSELFIAHYRPQEAVISCGFNNKHGHPEQEVLAVLNKYAVKVRRTDIEGTIVYKKAII
ncbi:MAG TPA: ComEC/Rec2 family competence protein [Bacilli bacterium]|nr:ComEC/Rec2 family competence protein [Bacilli bacterium]